MLEVINLEKSFKDKKVLQGINFKIEKGDIVGLIGPNGSGKSTAMKCITGLIRDFQGNVIVDGVDTKDNKYIENISAIIEAPGLYPNISGEKNLEIFCSLLNAPDARLEELKSFVNLGKNLYLPTKSYSMGMKQKLGIVIALIQDVDYLILDEPFNGLDIDNLFIVRELIKELAGLGKGILVSSHQLLELDKLTDRNIYLKSGKIIEIDEDERAFNTYKIEYRGILADIEKTLNHLLDEDNIDSFLVEEGLLMIETNEKMNIFKILDLLENIEIRSMDKLYNSSEEVYKLLYNE